MSVATMFAAAFLGFGVLQLVLLVADWRAGMLRRVKDLETALRETRTERDRWREAAHPHQAARAEWEHTREMNADLRTAKATLRRRLRGVLWQARAWKRAAVAYGWRRGDKAAPGALCACDEWRGPAHMAGCKYGRGEGGEP